MERYKICPTCGTKNPPTLLECLSCETDLTSVPIGDGVVPAAQAPNEAAASSGEPSKMVRVCECGQKNPASARKCSACGEDISDIMPTPETAIAAETVPQLHFVVSILDGAYAHEFPAGLTVIGRANVMQEYLAAQTFVSRRHAEVLVEANKLWIKGYKNTNHTFVNNVALRDDEYTELHDGDVVGLGGKEINGSLQDAAAYFRVRIGTCI